MKKIIVLCVLCLQGFQTFAQDSIAVKSNISFNLNADLVSRYLWRGLLFSPNVNIQPYAVVSCGNFSASTWASYGISDKYAEVDFSLSYSIEPLTISVNDYYTEYEDSLFYNKHFNWNKNSTPHSLEISLLYTVSESFPLSLTAATFVYGNDKKSDGKNAYSTYLEAAYPFTFSEYSFNFFIGGTTGEGLYSDKAAIVNAGFSASKELKISQSYSLPISASLVSNPKAEDIFLIFKMTF